MRRCGGASTSPSERLALHHLFMTNSPPFDVSLPKHWDEHLKSAFICAVSLAHRAFIIALTPCLNSVIDRNRLQGEILLLRSEVALLKEEMRIKDARSLRVAAAARPHYRPAERMAILAVKCHFSAPCGHVIFSIMQPGG